jgi:chromosome segregation ATPase
MSDASNVARSLRERLSGSTEERLGKALSDLLENPLLTGAIGRAFDAREKAVQAQEVAMGALNLPSAADIERLTRRLRSVSNRLEGIEDGVDRLDRAISPAGEENPEIDQRLSAIEAQLKQLTDKLDRDPALRRASKATKLGVNAKAKRTTATAKTTTAKAKAAKPKASRATAAGRAAAKTSSAKTSRRKPAKG